MKNTTKKHLTNSFDKLKLIYAEVGSNPAQLTKIGFFVS